MLFELFDALTVDEQERGSMVMALRILLATIPGIFALFALVGLGVRSPVLARAGAFAVWPVVLAIFLSLGVRWWSLLSRNVTSSLVEEHDRHAEWKPSDAEWNRLWVLTLVDTLSVLALVYVSALFKRIAHLYRRGGDPWHVRQPAIANPESTTPEGATHDLEGRRIIVEDSYGPDPAPVVVAPIVAGTDQIVEPVFHQS
ncbi:putative transmembrane protein [Gregarina niphandrodes]|uniref:Transmembrane protein n=1 Tax=Gregarina niphandrodes TaxID=110365 RepID=A0A023BAC7_GRENI|nr:putative transmembrane protein [Gregarina niphandrodes]EZG78197.1 putative transmembrane protein [Gregarina niphandrodes]|eukprot:XP_011129417.1 putative transmembrane protein [Gregarina niphandrodes]